MLPSAKSKSNQMQHDQILSASGTQATRSSTNPRRRSMGQPWSMASKSDMFDSDFAPIPSFPTLGCYNRWNKRTYGERARASVQERNRTTAREKLRKKIRSSGRRISNLGGEWRRNPRSGAARMRRLSEGRSSGCGRRRAIYSASQIWMDGSDCLRDEWTDRIGLSCRVSSRRRGARARSRLLCFTPTFTESLNGGPSRPRAQPNCDENGPCIVHYFRLWTL